MMPKNLVSKRDYRGVNVFLLHAMMYESPYWLTYNQAKELGGHVRKGERASPVVFWKRLEVSALAEPTGKRSCHSCATIPFSTWRSARTLPPLKSRL